MYRAGRVAPVDVLAVKVHVPLEDVRLAMADLDRDGTPEALPTDAPLPARMVLPNMLLQPVRAPKVRLHYASAESEPRLIGWAADEWLKRLDIPVDELLAYKARLLAEPKLSAPPPPARGI